MLLTVDPTATEPLFTQLAASVRQSVVRGATRPGDRLPAARDVAESLDVNIHTVLRAYQELRDEGLVDMRRGRGAVITDRARGYTGLADAVGSLVAEARRLGVGPSTLTALIREEYRS